MSKRTKFFRVATEGATVDERKISRSDIEQIAATFNRETYGARIWLEHRKGLLPDSVFKAYGDVLAVKAEEVDTNHGRKMALFAQLDPTPSLIEINRSRQKIYSSIEIDPDFADTGKPYLMGVGVTDTPASLGTEVLTFSSNRKIRPENMFSAAVEVELDFGEDQEDETERLTTRLKNLFSRLKKKEVSDGAKFDDIAQAVEMLSSHVVQTGEQYAAALERIDQTANELKATQDTLNAFKAQMDSEEAPSKKRPVATGGSGSIQTDF